MKIVQLANTYAPASGGLRTALDTLGRGYAAAGHERVLIVPGRGWDTRRGPDGTVLTVPGIAVGGGYRMILRTAAVERLLTRMRPDVIEVSDKYTLTGLAQWAAEHAVGSVLFSHERLDAIVPARFPVTARSVAAHSAIHAWNRRLARRFDAVVVTSAFAEDEFSGLGARALHRVPLGVDLDLFRPRPRPPDEPGRSAWRRRGRRRRGWRMPGGCRRRRRSRWRSRPCRCWPATGTTCTWTSTAPGPTGRAWSGWPPGCR